MIWTTVTILVLVLFFSTSDQFQTFLSPGPLSSPHGFLNQECSSCHGAAEKEPTAWVHAAMFETNALQESKRCLVCHPFGEEAGSAHSLPPEKMETIRHFRIERYRGLGLPASETRRDANEPLACMSCHHEHKGSDHNLKAMGNQTCQSCHNVIFESFATNHPDFEAFPYQDRPVIRFDHVTHLEKHFKEEEHLKNAPDSCGDCHFQKQPLGWMFSANFEDRCQGCHLGDIMGDAAAGLKGTPFIAVPGLDLESLEASGFRVGTWPFFADHDLTPFSSFLMIGSAWDAARLEKVKSLDLMDLSSASREDQALAADFALAFKQMLFEIYNGGQESLRVRIANAAQPTLPSGNPSNFDGLISRMEFRAAVDTWFPNLEEEMKTIREGKSLEPTLEKAAKTKAPTKEKKKTEDDDILDDDILAGDDDILAGDDDILSGDDDILAGDDDILSDAGDTAQNASPVIVADQKLSAEDWVHQGGWYETNFSLLYRPMGHRDPFFKTWSELTAASPEGSPGALIFEMLSDEKATGSCFKCHAVLEWDEKVRPMWKPRYSHQKAFTAFNHTPHVTGMGESSCDHCHNLDPEADFQATFAGTQNAPYTANFKPLEKDVCAECHIPEKAGDDCLLCHNYHIIEKVFPHHDSGPFNNEPPAEAEVP